MSEPKAILLCGGRIAIPVLRDLFFYKQIAAIVIPMHAVEFIEQVQALLNDHDLPVIIVNRENLTDELQRAVIKYHHAIGIVFGFSFKLPAAVIAMPEKGFYNIHPGPLPGYRGPDPLFWQIKNKEPYAAVSIHKIDEGFDSGPIVLTDKIRIAVTDTYGILTTKIAELATTMVATLMKMAAFDMPIPSRQQDNSKACYHKRQAAAAITINWQTMNAVTIIALINACNPWNKGAVTMIGNRVMRLLDAYPVDIPYLNNASPGTILSLNENGMVIAVRDNESICVTMIYCDEGFLMAGRLKELSIMPGLQFNNI